MRKESDGEILETLCRLCGTNDCGRMLHLGDTYSMVGTSDIIFNLLDSISVILKLEVCMHIYCKCSELDCIKIEKI